MYQAASSEGVKKGSEVLVLYEEDGYVFDSSGKSVHTLYRVYKILSEKGADGWDGVSVEWEPWHEEKPEVRARVITSDRANHLLDPKSITDSPANDTNEKEYGDRRIVRAPLPAIAPGSLVEVETTVREKVPLFSAGVVERSGFGSFSPVRDSQLVLDAPVSLNLQYTAQLLPQLKIQRKEEDGRVFIRFQQGPMDVLEIAERYSPSDQPAYPKVIFRPEPPGSRSRRVTARSWMSRSARNRLQSWRSN